MDGSARQITTLLNRAKDDRQAEEKLFRLVQSRFRQIAAAHFRTQPKDHTLQETALVDDAFQKLVRGQASAWSNSEQFFSAAARVMRQLLIDHARRKAAEKRGAGEQPARLDDLDKLPNRSIEDPHRLAELDDILSRLESTYPKTFAVFQLHFFGGWTLREIADEILGVSVATVKRRWNMAKAFLRTELTEG